MTAAAAGEAACLAAATCWAFSVRLYSRPIQRHGARSVNASKCVVAAVLQGVTILALGQGARIAAAPPRELGYLAASGLVGLSLGDTALFGAVARIGAYRTLLLQTLSPVFAAILAALARGEVPGSREVIGAAVVLAGVALVVRPGRSPAPVGAAVPLGSPGRPDRAAGDTLGTALGVLAAFGQGAGLVLAKSGMETLPYGAASFLRLAFASIGLLAVETWSGRAGRLGVIARSGRDLSRLIPGIVLGSYIGLFLMMSGVSSTPAAVSATLLSTSPVISLLLEAVVDRRPLTAAGVGGTLLAVAGVGILSA